MFHLQKSLGPEAKDPLKCFTLAKRILPTLHLARSTIHPNPRDPTTRSTALGGAASKQQARPCACAYSFRVSVTEGLITCSFVSLLTPALPNCRRRIETLVLPHPSPGSSQQQATFLLQKSPRHTYTREPSHHLSTWVSPRSSRSSSYSPSSAARPTSATKSTYGATSSPTAARSTWRRRT